MDSSLRLPARHDAEPRRVAPKHSPLAAQLLFTLLTLAIWALPSASSGLAALSVTASAMGIVAALRRGGRYLTPSGVYFLASAVFIGGAAYYLSFVDTRVAPSALRLAGCLALLSTIAVWAVVTSLDRRWTLTWPTRRRSAHLTLANNRPPAGFALKGAGLILVSFLPLAQSVLGPLADAAGLGGVIILVLWASARSGPIRRHEDIFIRTLVLVVPLTWVYFNFTGGGRLTVAGLGIASFVGWNLMNPGRARKVLLVCSIPLFLAFAGLSRVGLQSGNQASATSVVSSGQGLGSVYSPLETFARMTSPATDEKRRELKPKWGATFLNTAVLPVPRSLWPTKPKGFGAELTEVLEPQLVSADHSMAALFQGEWYANFGYLGLLAMVPVTGWTLAVLDRRHSQLCREGLTGAQSWWRAAVVLCLVSSLADLVWVGTFTFFARGGLAALVVALVGKLSASRR